jgi:hypothetical protein
MKQSKRLVRLLRHRVQMLNFNKHSEISNKQRIQQYATYESNLKMLTQTQQLHNLKSDQMKSAVDKYKDLHDQFTQGQIL